MQINLIFAIRAKSTQDDSRLTDIVVLGDSLYRDIEAVSYCSGLDRVLRNHLVDPERNRIGLNRISIGFGGKISPNQFGSINYHRCWLIDDDRLARWHVQGNVRQIDRIPVDDSSMVIGE